MGNEELAKLEYPAWKEPKEEHLVTEYTNCRTIVENSAARSWQSLGVILGGALAGAILLLPDLRKIWLPAFVFVVVGVVFLLLYLLWFLRRERGWRQELAYHRMLEIEEKLGLRIDWDYVVSDRRRKMCKQQWEKELGKMSAEDAKRWGKPTKHHCLLGPYGWWWQVILIGLVIVLWVFLIIARIFWIN